MLARATLALCTEPFYFESWVTQVTVSPEAPRKIIFWRRLVKLFFGGHVLFMEQLLPLFDFWSHLPWVSKLWR